MRQRRYAYLLALLGVLLHASLVAQHNAVSLSRLLNNNAPEVGLSLICHDGNATASPAPTIPDRSQHQPDWNYCPLCAGLAPAFAILGTVAFDFVRSETAPASVPIYTNETRVCTAQVRPPTRGPPLGI